MLNNGADALAAGGSNSHTEDYGVAVVREFALRRIRRNWGYLLKVDKMVRGQAQRRAQEGMVRGQGRPRKECIDNTWNRQHRLGCWGPTQACEDCGRTYCRGSRQARLRQWRQGCAVLGAIVGVWIEGAGLDGGVNGF